MPTYSAESTLGPDVSVVIVDGGEGPLVFARKDDAKAEFKKLVLSNCEDPSSLPEDMWDDHEHSYWSDDDTVIRIYHTTLILDDNREENT